MGTGVNAPVIIKRKKVVAGGGHHGGAWKVAYADFVTAMMAFFLLMWLLNATTEQQRRGLSDYFAPTVPISRTSGGADGMFGGNSLNSEEPLVADGSEIAHAVTGQEMFPQHPNDEGTAAVEAAEVAALREVEDVLLARGGESVVAEQALRHVVTRLTDEGLVIEIFALPGVPLFAGDSADPLPMTRDLVDLIAGVIGLVTNEVAVAGHVPARPVMLAVNPVWDLSTARADAVRVLLEQAGLPSARLARVTGHADRAPAVPDRPFAERNDRFEITLLRGDRP